MSKRLKKQRSSEPNPTPWKMPEADLPKVGDIWKLDFPYGDEYKEVHYLLIAQANDEFLPSGNNTFDMLILENGETLRLYMNFELDDWQFVA